MAEVTEAAIVVSPGTAIVQDDRNSSQKMIGLLDGVYDGAHVAVGAATLVGTGVALGTGVACLGAAAGAKSAFQEIADALKERKALKGRRFGTR